MTERPGMERFETRLTDRIHGYTDVATARRIDALGIARAAMLSSRAIGWQARLGAGLLGGRIAGVGWTAAFMVLALIGVVAIAVVGRQSESAGVPIPDALRHAWERPLPVVAPGPDLWGSGFLILTNGEVEFGREPGAAASRSSITAARLDALVVTATGETNGCAIGDVGTYHWSIKGKGTVLTLTAIGTDACAAREEALAGMWVRSDLPHATALGGGEAMLSAGTHSTSSFDPFGAPAVSGQLSYTVREGWKVKEDQPGSFVLHNLPDAPYSTDSLIFLLAHPRLAADIEDGATCGPPGDAPGVGHSVDELVAAITARPGVVSTPPAAVTIGGYDGKLLDLRLATSWTRGCTAPEGLIVGVPILHEAGVGTGPAVGLAPDHPLRLILLDLGDGRTMAIATFSGGPSQPSAFEERVAVVMPVIESFEFHAPTQ